MSFPKWLVKEKLAALFIVDMGNYARNSFFVPQVFHTLRNKSLEVEFVGYHRRRSGNFVFLDTADNCLGSARLMGESVTKLPCLVRRHAEWEAVMQAVPGESRTIARGSVELPTVDGPRKIVWAGLSNMIPRASQFIGAINSRVSIVSWPTYRDVLCLYDRPGSGGDVGQVTRAVIKALERRGLGTKIVATGRAVSVLRDLLEGNGVTWVYPDA